MRFNNTLVSYKGKTRRLPKRYLSNLKGSDLKKQIKSIFEGKKRPKIKSRKARKSTWTAKFDREYGDEIVKLKGGKTLKNISKVSGISEKALKEVYNKGAAAYFTGGSRPNQTPESWAYARVYSYIMGGNTRKVDTEVTEKYNVKFKHT